MFCFEVTAWHCCRLATLVLINIVAISDTWLYSLVVDYPLPGIPSTCFHYNCDIDPVYIMAFYSNAIVLIMLYDRCYVTFPVYFCGHKFIESIPRMLDI